MLNTIIFLAISKLYLMNDESMKIVINDCDMKTIFPFLNTNIL